MEMWLKRSTLVLLTAALVISDQALVILNETRTTVKVPLGSSVTFQCRLKTEAERLWVIWFLNPSSFQSHNLSKELFSKSAKNSSLVLNQTKQDSRDEGQDTEGTWPTYILSNVTEQDSGWYFCSFIIDIPVLKQINSSGTEVVIMKSKEHTTYPGKQATVSPIDNFTLSDQWMWITLGVSSVILIVLLVICVLLRRRRRRSREEDPVYANTRPVANKQPSPRPGMDHLKAVSSSQTPRNLSPGRKYDEGKRRYK